MLPTSWAARLKLLLPSSRRRILYSISLPLSQSVPCTLLSAPYDARFFRHCQPPPAPRSRSPEPAWARRALRADVETRPAEMGGASLESRCSEHGEKNGPAPGL